MKRISFRKEKAISPIIATLLLILIAIAAGVVVYAYVIGFVGSTTGGSNSRGVLSIDLASATSASGKVTVFIRNTGSLAESFNNGFYIAGQSLASTQLSLAVIVTAAAVSSGTATVAIARVASNQFSLTPSGTWSGSFTLSFLGVTSASFTGNVAQTLTIPSTGVTIASGTTFTSVSITTTTTAGTALSTSMTGTLTLGVSGYQEFDLTGATLSAGSSYTVTVIAQDGTTVTASVKSS